jgi:acetyl-CoA synthetase
VSFFDLGAARRMFVGGENMTQDSNDLPSGAGGTSDIGIRPEQSDGGDATWAMARGLIDGWKGGINIAHEALDRHVEKGHGDQIAIRWLAKSGPGQDFTYADMAEMAARFANVLTSHGLAKGDSVFALMGRVPELYATALGTLKAGLVFTPLFSAFGPEPIRTRMEIGSANVLVTTASIYKRKIAVARRDTDPEAGAHRWRRGAGGLRHSAWRKWREAEARFETVETTPEDPR